MFPLIGATIAVIGTMVKTNLWRKGFILPSSLYVCHLGMPGQELKQRPWGNAASWLATHGLLSLLSYITQNP